MKRKIERGKELTELAKGSLEYTLNLMSNAFRRQFPYEDRREYWIVETFADHVIVTGWNDDDLKSDEFYRVTYTRNGDEFNFATHDQWEIVELAYQPQTVERPSLMERTRAKNRGKGKRLDEALGAVLKLDESQASNDAGPWKIKAIGITANVINANGRRYSAEVLREAVEEAQTHLTESFSQGRLVITGEPEHPKDKGTGRPTLLETVTNWTGISFDGTHVMLEGLLLGTSAGRDIHAQMIGGVMPDVSQRAKGDSHPVKNGEQLFEDVDWCRITGYDLVANGWGSDPDAGVTFSESKDLTEGEDMTKEELIKFLAEHPELFKGVTKEQVESMNADALKMFEESVRKAMGIGADADLMTELAESAKARKELAEAKQAKAVADAITDQTKGLKYGKALNESFVASIQAAQPKTPDAVKALVESKRVEYDKIASALKLAGMGFQGNGAQVLGPVIDGNDFRETGAVHILTESLVKRGVVKARDYTDRSKLSPNDLFTALYLERYDQLYASQLKREARLFEEAETSDTLNLPYSISRVIIAEALPQLVASSIFDVTTTDQSPSRIYYEAYVGESGASVAITDESVVMPGTANNGWKALAFKRVTPGTVTVTSSPAGTNYEEGTDYIIDYANGQIKGIGTLANTAATLLVDYTYSAIRKGENQPIERGRVALTYKTLEIAADRLATEITSEAITFSRMQLGWDAVGRTIAALINQIRRKIDQGMFYAALTAALSVANNSGGSWTASGTDYEVAVRAIGAARVKVAKRYYQPTAILMSTGNSDLIANWEGFTQAGQRPGDAVMGNGFVGSLKGLPVFGATEFPDGYILVLNREIVMHRVFQPMTIKGPYPTYEASTQKLIAAEQWYAEEYNGTDAPVPEKAAYVIVS